MNVVRRRQYYEVAVSLVHVERGAMGCIGRWKQTNLRFREDGAEAVEELEGCDDLALYQGARENCSCRPPTGAYWHFPEPGLEREAAYSSAFVYHLIHDAGCSVLYIDR